MEETEELLQASNRQIDRLEAEIERLRAIKREFDANVDRLKACEHIADGDEGWERLVNECPSTAAVGRLRASRAEAHVILQSWVLASEDLSAEGISSLRATADHEHECFLAAKAWCQKIGPVTLEEAARFRTALNAKERGRTMSDLHTPGPWRALCLKQYTRVTRDSQGRGDETGSVQICHIAGPEEADLRPFNKDRWEADARLIAAAPDMKAEIERLRASNAELELKIHATEQEALQEIAKRDVSNAELVGALTFFLQSFNSSARRQDGILVASICEDVADKARAALTNAKAAGMKPVASYPNAFPKTNAKEQADGK